MEKLDPQDRTPLLKPDDFASMLINPAANRSNLPPGYIENTLAALPSRQRARFLEGVWLDENTDALWQPEMFHRSRVTAAPDLSRIVIGVDPAVTSNGKESASFAIIRLFLRFLTVLFIGNAILYLPPAIP